MGNKVGTRPFKLKQDLEILNEWLKLRNLTPISTQGVPRLGLLAESKEYPIAAAFLRHCEGNVAMLDGLVSNPKASSAERHQGIDLIVKRLLEIAKEIKVNRIFAFTDDPSVLTRSEKHGFKSTHFKVISVTV